jgi:hypothetical protein
MSIDIIEISEQVRVRIEYDTDPVSPSDWDNLGEIAYSSSRYSLGTECVSHDRLDEIAAGIRKGDLVGLPVYAYVHGSAMISCGTRLKQGAMLYGNPFSCPWDSGQSGFVYCTKEAAIKEFGKKILTARVKRNVLRCLANEVEGYSQYLEGDVYGVIVERLEDEEWVDKESCWGFYGLEYAREEANRMGEWEAKQDEVTA